MYCKKCKTEYEEGAVFCQECGEKIDGQNSQINDDDLQFGNGVKAWLIILIVRSMLSIVLTIIIGITASAYVNSVFSGIRIAVEICIPILICLGSLILMEIKRRMGFYLIVVASVMSAIDCIIAGSVVRAIVPLLISLFTYFILSKYWFYMD